MTTTALVPVFTGQLQNQPVQLCNARDLHAVLEVGRDFTTWIKGRVEEYGFAEGEDFLTVTAPPIRGAGNRGKRTDYHLTLDMAKELAMVENNDRGRQVRRYFIQVEKEARQQAATLPAPALDLRAVMLSDNSTPEAPLPAEVQSAINRRAWTMAHDAYELCREYLARRVAYTSECGYPQRQINVPRALAIVAETTLDMALTPRHYNQLAMVLSMAKSMADTARENHAKLAEDIGKLQAQGMGYSEYPVDFVMSRHA